MQQGSECEFCRTFACVFMFLFNFNDFTTLNFNKITLIIVKHFQILTNRIVITGLEGNSMFCHLCTDDTKCQGKKGRRSYSMNSLNTSLHDERSNNGEAAKGRTIFIAFMY